MNLVQRSSLAIGICLGIVAVFLHNPLSGYAIEVNHPATERPCSDAEKRKLRDDYLLVETLPNRSGYTREQIEEKVRLCTTWDSSTQYLPFGQWQTNSPHFYWLGRLINLSFAILCLCLMGIVVFLVFREHSNPKDG